ncbi:unnamed protein product [Polarella glacialis]|uniref:Uncharacterized protein n=1 Tax=Polarella glacialis TaxID=89957 RepID=A0A813HC78_POLGL|nr:unnamed protein product [Polarella glacialis]
MDPIAHAAEQQRRASLQVEAETRSPPRPVEDEDEGSEWAAPLARDVPASPEAQRQRPGPQSSVSGVSTVTAGSGASCSPMYKVDHIGRHMRSSKLRHAWTLYLPGEPGEVKVELEHSRFSGKKKVLVDGQVVFTTKESRLKWSWEHPRSKVLISLVSENGNHSLSYKEPPPCPKSTSQNPTDDHDNSSLEAVSPREASTSPSLPPRTISFPDCLGETSQSTLQTSQTDVLQASQIQAQAVASDEVCVETARLHAMLGIRDAQIAALQVELRRQSLEASIGVPDSLASTLPVADSEVRLDLGQQLLLLHVERQQQQQQQQQQHQQHGHEHLQLQQPQQPEQAVRQAADAQAHLQQRQQPDAGPRQTQYLVAELQPPSPGPAANSTLPTTSSPQHAAPAGAQKELLAAPCVPGSGRPEAPAMPELQRVPDCWDPLDDEELDVSRKHGPGAQVRGSPGSGSSVAVTPPRPQQAAPTPKSTPASSWRGGTPRREQVEVRVETVMTPMAADCRLRGRAGSMPPPYSSPLMPSPQQAGGARSSGRPGRLLSVPPPPRSLSQTPQGWRVVGLPGPPVRGVTTPRRDTLVQVRRSLTPGPVLRSPSSGPSHLSRVALPGPPSTYAGPPGRSTPQMVPRALPQGVGSLQLMWQPRAIQQGPGHAQVVPNWHVPAPGQPQPGLWAPNVFLPPPQPGPQHILPAPRQHQAPGTVYPHGGSGIPAHLVPQQVSI